MSRANELTKKESKIATATEESERTDDGGRWGKGRAADEQRQAKHRRYITTTKMQKKWQSMEKGTQTDRLKMTKHSLYSQKNGEDFKGKCKYQTEKNGEKQQHQ
ncbi:hypothetical protein niasHS_010293 [Heterodera schachtii]|uniref:Uncharacterized protein n=1 Tax=Heterodera schachtii TaxID=97005 RepID=A0ABD2IZC0_HETSC